MFVIFVLSVELLLFTIGELLVFVYLLIIELLVSLVFKLLVWLIKLELIVLFEMLRLDERF